MGTRIPRRPTVDPVVAGNACSNCWGVGKPFGIGDTPEFVFLTFSGVNKGPNWILADGDPIDGDFLMTQDAIFPCVYFGSDADFLLDLEFKIADTEIGVLAATGPIAFQAFGNDPCELFVENKNDDHFTGGSVVITLPAII